MFDTIYSLIEHRRREIKAGTPLAVRLQEHEVMNLY